MNGSIEHATVQYVNKPYKRKRSAPAEPDIIEISPPLKSATLKIVDKSCNTLKKLENSENLDRLSPFSKMLINPDDKKDPEVISLDPGSPIPQSPISIASNILSESFIFPENADQAGLSSPLSISPHTNGISIYAEANARSKVCKPVLLIKRERLGEEVAAQLVERYSYLYPSPDSDDGRSSDEKTEIKLKEFVQDYMIQKKYKDSGAVKAKMKKTPTLAELKVTKHKKRVLEQRNMALIRPSEETTADGLRTLQLPSHSQVEATIISESEEGSVVDASDSEEEAEEQDEEKEDIEVIEERPTTTESATIESLQQAYEQVHKKRSLYPSHSQYRAQQGTNTPYTFGTNRNSGPCRTLDLREPPPTMLLHKSHYNGLYNYISKEHDYCLYYHRPKNVKWEVSRTIPNFKDPTPAPAPLTPANTLLLNALPRPNYVMSEPWLFVPSVEDARHEAEVYQQALGFETVMRHMLKSVDSPQASLVECAKCSIDFSSEWFTFMSKRLCKECYKREVKSRNSIIYLTNISHIARKAHDRVGQS